MQDDSLRPQTFNRKTAGVITVTGQGVRLRVMRHALQIEDGFPLESPQRIRRVTRAVERVHRVLFLAHSGWLTVDVLDWCDTNSVPVVAVDQSGYLRWTLLPGKGGEWWSRLRRAQALAPFTETGLEIARWIVSRKLTGQRDVLKEVGQDKDTVEALLRQVERARTISHLRHLEAGAADFYWKAWVGLPVHFAPPSYKKTVAHHWTAFRGRGSPLNNGARNAVDPVNAILNYAYALLEAESRIACHEAGLDPYLSCAGLHTDQDARRSLIYDVMEPARPVADRLVLNLVRSHAFRPGEMWALRDGRCVLDQDLCACLWPWMPTFRKALGPVMTSIVSRLRQGVRYGERAGRTGGRRYWASEVKPLPLRTAGACRSCGVLLEGMINRQFCDACWSERGTAVINSNLSRANDRLRRLRREGRDPAHGGIAARARTESLTRNREKILEWERANARPKPEEFRRAILPRLQRMTLREMMRATGLCSGYCSMIRKGKFIPHARHWKTLQTLIQVEK